MRSGIPHRPSFAPSSAFPISYTAGLFPTVWNISDELSPSKHKHNLTKRFNNIQYMHEPFISYYESFMISFNLPYHLKLIIFLNLWAPCVRTDCAHSTEKLRFARSLTIPGIINIKPHSFERLVRHLTYDLTMWLNISEHALWCHYII